MTEIIYADNAATTKLDLEAYEAMKPFLLNDYSNPSQPYSFSRRAKKAMKEAREIIAECINAEPDEICFTSGGTESDNWAIKGCAFSLGNKKNIVTSNIEHHAVIRSCEFLKTFGYRTIYLKANKNGIILPETLNNEISENTGIVSVMLANNEIGTIQPIKELAKIAHKKGALFHTDAVQAMGHIPIDVKNLDVDLLSASAHKFNGPKGIGFLYVKNGSKLLSYINGGMQENGLRAGTENIASIVGMAYALKRNVEELTKNINYIRELDTEMVTQLKKANIDFIRNGIEPHLPGNISLSFKGISGEMLLHRLDLMGIMVSTGSACDSTKTQISHVLKAINIHQDYIEGTIRISLSKENTMEDVNCIVSGLTKIILQSDKKSKNYSKYHLAKNMLLP